MDKLTQPVTVKFCERGIAFVQRRSTSLGMEVSEYMRDLVEKDRAKARADYESLREIFGHEDGADKGNEG